MKINIDKVPERFCDYISYLKRYCLQHRCNLFEGNKHLLCIEVAKGYGIEDTQNAELLQTLVAVQCDDVCEIIEDAYDKKFPRCYGGLLNGCSPSAQKCSTIDIEECRRRFANGIAR